MPTKCSPPEDGRDVIAAWAEAMTFTPNLDDRAALLQLLGNGTRMRMFFVLDRLEAVCVCDLAEILGVTQSAVSQHLAKFRAHRLVTSRRDGQTLFYSLAESADVDLLRRLGIADIETPPYG
ncbi:MAG: metalloregulator ArsR/SmtB family transcription factor [Polyangiaceae bacterium]